MTITSRFPLLGEPIALDLVNTRVHRAGAIVDLLASVAALDEWLRAERGRLMWNGRVSAADLAAVRDLRSDLDTLLRARQQGAPGPAATVRKLNRVLATPTPRLRLVWRRKGPRRPAPTGTDRRSILLHQLATDALELLTGPKAALLRCCAHPDCILLFVASNSRRRWCSGALCGNRARVARNYQRRHWAQ